MNIILFLLSTIVISICLETMNEVTMFKDIADRGYKINMDKLSTVQTLKENILIYIKLLIPGLNIIDVLKRMYKYEKGKNELFSNLDNSDIFIKLSEDEYTNYLENPKSINALNLSLREEDKKEIKKEILKPQGFIKINNGVYRQEYGDGTFTEIKFRNDDDKVIVMSIDGKILSLEEVSKIFKTLYNKSVFFDNREDVSFQKEQLIAHKEEIMSLLDEEEYKLKLK